MSQFLDTALDLARRNLRVLPLAPRDKHPIVPGGHKAGTTDPEQITLWWKKNLTANIGIAAGLSDLVVMDADHGLIGHEDFIAWRDRNGLPPTYTVHSGRRPEYGAQMYYRRKGGITTQGRKTFKLDGVTGDFKSQGGLVVHPPSIHPDSGEAYEIACDLPIAECPELILNLPTAEGKEKSAETNADGLIETDNRNDDMCSFIGKIRKQIPNLGEPECLEICLRRNDRYAKGPMDMDEVEEIARKQFRLYTDVGPDPIATIGEPKESEAPKDWRECYHSIAEHDNVGPPRFLIEDFLPEQSIMGIGAFVGQKKTLVALNIVHSLCSGEPLFGKYKVTRKPSRVLYLGPENGLMSFSNRVNRIGLREYLCKTFFYSTMSQTQRLLPALTPEETEDAAIVIDTAIRFTDGSENDAAMMKAFAEHAFALIRNKAACVIMLHHSPKFMTQANELTLQNSFRGTGELSAFLSVAIAMRTQDMEHEYDSPSLLRFVKQRDFEPSPASFEVKTDKETCRMTFKDGSDGATVALVNAADKDGKEEVALRVIQDNPNLSLKKLERKLREMGIERSATWIGNKRNALTGTGVTLSDNHGA